MAYAEFAQCYLLGFLVSAIANVRAVMAYRIVDWLNLLTGSTPAGSEVNDRKLLIQDAQDTWEQRKEKHMTSQLKQYELHLCAPLCKLL
jgi:hypothetical protein